MRNTERAEVSGGGKKISKPILTSVVAAALSKQRQHEDRQSRAAAESLHSREDIIAAAAACQAVLEDMLQRDEALTAQGIVVSPSEVMRDLLVQGQLAEAQLAEARRVFNPGAQRRESLVAFDAVLWRRLTIFFGLFLGLSSRRRCPRPG